MAKFNHMLDIAFTVETDMSDPKDIDSKTLVKALLERMFMLIEDGEFVVGETISHVDTILAELERREG